jgi:hypothetical protein
MQSANEQWLIKNDLPYTDRQLEAFEKLVRESLRRSLDLKQSTPASSSSGISIARRLAYHDVIKKRTPK